MTERPVIHDTFVIERTYPASPSRVFAAFASREAKDAWGDRVPAAGLNRLSPILAGLQEGRDHPVAPLLSWELFRFSDA